MSVRLNKILGDYSILARIKQIPHAGLILNSILELNRFETRKRDRAMTNTPETKLDTTDLSRMKQLDIVAFNALAEMLFIEITKDFISEEGPQSVSSICAEAAFELDISIETAKRYLLKHSARRAEFQIKDKVVNLR